MRYDPTDFGAVGNARSDDTRAFQHLFEVAGSATATIVIAKVYAVGGLVFPANFTLSFEDGGLALFPGGTPVTIDGPLDAQLQQIFFLDLSVRFRPGSVLEIYPEWWGAKGNGTTDDRNAIGHAVGASSSTRKDGKEIHDRTEGSWIASIAPVVFSGPAYNISSAISCDAFNIFLSRSRSRLRQTKSTETHFHMGNAFRCAVIGLQFVGGKHAIWYYNENIDQGRLVVRDCSFQLTNDYAIRVGGSGSKNDTNSTNVLIENCEFYSCKQIAENSADQFLLKNCWVWLHYTKTPANTAAFVNRGFQMIFEQMFGVPDIDDPAHGKLANVRWVDNYNRFYARDCRFGGESGGIGTVWHFAPPDGSANGPAIEIYGGYLAAGQALDPAAGVIHLRTHVPQLVVIHGTRGIDQVPVIANTGSLNLDTYFDAYSPVGGPSASEKFRFSVDANLMSAPGAMPPQLFGFLTQKDRILAGTLSAAPSVGYYEAGQRRPRTPSLGKAQDFVCLKDGKPGAWCEAGKLSPWHVGQVRCTDIGGNRTKIVFDLPSGYKSFVAILSLSARPSAEVTGLSRATASYLISLGITSSAGVMDTLAYTLLHSHNTGTTPPGLDSLHFGIGDTGSSAQSHGKDGQFTAVFGNVSRGSADASIELLHLGS
jgi:hypothetical protein